MPPCRPHSWPLLPPCPRLGESGVLGSGRPSAAPSTMILSLARAQPRAGCSSHHLPPLRPMRAVRVSHARIKGPLGTGSPNRASSPRQSQALKWEKAGQCVRMRGCVVVRSKLPSLCSPPSIIIDVCSRNSLPINDLFRLHSSHCLAGHRPHSPIPTPEPRAFSSPAGSSGLALGQPDGRGTGACSISRNPRVPHPGTLACSGVL